MNKYIDQFEGVLYNLGGYALIPADKRPTLTLSDGFDDTKTTQIKSLVAVDDNCGQLEATTRIKCIDADDEMWDVEEYVDEAGLNALLNCIK